MLFCFITHADWYLGKSGHIQVNCIAWTVPQLHTGLCNVLYYIAMHKCINETKRWSWFWSKPEDRPVAWAGNQKWELLTIVADMDATHERTLEGTLWSFLQTNFELLVKASQTVSVKIRNVSSIFHSWLHLKKFEYNWKVNYLVTYCSFYLWYLWSNITKTPDFIQYFETLCFRIRILNYNISVHVFQM